MSDWREYDLDPSALAVGSRDVDQAGLSLVWKGGIGVSELGDFFVAATRRLFPNAEPRCRAWFVTPDGARHVDMNATGIAAVPDELSAQMGYVRFECWPDRFDIPDEPSAVRPAFAAWTNRDQEATSLADLQQCVGIQIKPADIPRLRSEITAVVGAIGSPFFAAGSYDSQTVSDILTGVHGAWEGRSSDAAAAGF